jgi:hypothetical protein
MSLRQSSNLRKAQICLCVHEMRIDRRITNHVLEAKLNLRSKKGAFIITNVYTHIRVDSFTTCFSIHQRTRVLNFNAYDDEEEEEELEEDEEE